MTVKADDHKAIAKNLSEGTMKVTGTEEEIKEYKKQLAKLKKPGIGEFYEGKEGHTRTLDSTQVDITKACIPLVVDRLGRIIGPSLLNGKA